MTRSGRRSRPGSRSAERRGPRRRWRMATGPSPRRRRSPPPEPRRRPPPPPDSAHPGAKEQPAGKTTTRRTAQPKRQPAAKTTRQRPAQPKKPAAAKTDAQAGVDDRRCRTTTRRRRTAAPRRIRRRDGARDRRGAGAGTSSGRRRRSRRSGSRPSRAPRIRARGRRRGPDAGGGAGVRALRRRPGPARHRRRLDRSRRRARVRAPVDRPVPAGGQQEAALLEALPRLSAGERRPGDAAHRDRRRRALRRLRHRHPAVARQGGRGRVPEHDRVRGGIADRCSTSRTGRGRARSSSAPAPPRGSYHGVRLFRYPSGTELAFVSHYLAVGQGASVRAAIDVSTGAAPSLATEPGVRARGGRRSRPAACSTPTPPPPACSGFSSRAGACSARSECCSTARARRHRDLVSAGRGRRAGPDPQRAQPGAEAASGPRSTVPPDAAGRRAGGLDADPRHRRPRQGGAARSSAAAAAGIAGRVGPLLDRLGRALAAEGVSPRSIVSIFAGESAVAILPGSSGPTGGSRPPSLVIIARTNERGADQDHAGEHGGAARPAVRRRRRQVPGRYRNSTTSRSTASPCTSSSLTPGLQLDYAVFDGLVVVSTSLDAIDEVVSHQRGDRRGPGVPGDAGNPPAAGLLATLSRLQPAPQPRRADGPNAAARVRALPPDLAKIRAIGLDSTSGEATRPRSCSSRSHEHAR